MAVSGFASSSWAVRNASMQLFGKRANDTIAWLPQGRKWAGKKFFTVGEKFELGKIDILKKSQGK